MVLDFAPSKYPLGSNIAIWRRRWSGYRFKRLLGD
jgi:hypothetical protein